MVDLVSIIVPIYGVEEYLEECIESIVGQTYKNLEIILVDDESPDGSPEICDRWAAKDSRIKVIHKKNGGLSSARNTGLNSSRGKYVYFLDGDDYIERDLISTVLPYLNEGYEMVAFNYHLLYDNNIITSKVYNSQAEYTYNTEEEKKEFLVKYLLTSKLGWAAWSRIFRRDIIEQYSIKFADNRVVFAEDLYFSLCYCAHCKNIICLDDLLHYYRQRKGSIMAEENVRLNANRMNELGKAVLAHYTKHEDCKVLISIFPVIHFMILDNVISRYRSVINPSIRDLREIIIKDLEDFAFFKNQLEKLKYYRRVLNLAYSKVATEASISISKFYIDGKYMLYEIRHQFIRVYALLIRMNKFLKARRIG